LYDNAAQVFNHASNTYNPLSSNDFTLYQSTDSLAALTTSTSSGFWVRSQPGFDIDTETVQFQRQNPLVVNLHVPAEPQPIYHDLNGNLNEPVFVHQHPVVASMMADFVTMTCLLLYYNVVLQSWPSSFVLDAFTLKAIDIILKAHVENRTYIAENSKHIFIVSICDIHL
jgi:hypothetical protein